MGMLITANSRLTIRNPSWQPVFENQVVLHCAFIFHSPCIQICIKKGKRIPSTMAITTMTSQRTCHSQIEQFRGMDEAAN